VLYQQSAESRKKKTIATPQYQPVKKEKIKTGNRKATSKPVDELFSPRPDSGRANKSVSKRLENKSYR
jgi:hypothetical protein